MSPGSNRVLTTKEIPAFKASDSRPVDLSKSVHRHLHISDAEIRAKVTWNNNPFKLPNKSYRSCR